MKLLYDPDADFAVIVVVEFEGPCETLDLYEHYDAEELEAPALTLQFADGLPTRSQPAPTYLTQIMIHEASHHLPPAVLAAAERITLKDDA